MALGNKAGAIEENSGGICFLKEVLSTGADLAVPATPFQIGFIAETDLNDKQTIKKVSDETGKTVKKIDGERAPSLTLLLMQSDKETLDFLRQGCRDKYYQVIKYEGIIDGKHQYIVIPIAEITPGIALKSGTKQPPMEITILDNKTEITISTYPTGCNLTAPTVISAGEMYEISEIAAA